jgi:glycosyltransferase involved in cell wall biosynthesis
MVRLERRGHEVHVLCGDTRLPGDPPPPDADHERRVRRQLRLYHDGARILRPPVRERLDIERHNQRVLEQAIREVRPDVISVWHLAGASQGLLTTIARAGIPVVFAVCDDWLVYGVRLDAWMAPFDRSPLRRAAGRVVERLTGLPCVVADVGELGAFLFVSRTTEANALAGARWSFARRAVVWSGIDRATYPEPGPVAARPWSWRLVTTGRFDPRKGFETVIRALPLLPPEATLACWGRGGEAERRRLQQLAAELGVRDRVRFGSLEREELPAAYADADVMVFPSTWAEPFGLVPVEAMACDTPVVATRVGGSAEFLTDGGNCLAFPPGDSVALAAAVRRLAGDEELRRRLVLAGRATVEVLDVERLADVMEAWHLYEAAGGRGPLPELRPGIPPEPGPRVALRLCGSRQALLECSEAGPGSVLADPQRLPIRGAALRSTHLRTDGMDLAGRLDGVVAELARVVEAGGVLAVDGPNPADLRGVRTRVQARWWGWRRLPMVPIGAVEPVRLELALRAHATVVRSGTGAWGPSLLGRAATALVRVLRVSGRGPRAEVEGRRR